MKRQSRVAARFSRVPQTLDQELARHRGELYSSDTANRYAEQVKTYLGRSASQLEDEVFGLNALRALSKDVDVIVLAQASMARVVDALSPEDKPVPILSSPRLAMEHLATLCAGSQ